MPRAGAGPPGSFCVGGSRSCAAPWPWLRLPLLTTAKVKGGRFWGVGAALAVSCRWRHLCPVAATLRRVAIPPSKFVLCRHPGNDAAYLSYEGNQSAVAFCRRRAGIGPRGVCGGIFNLRVQGARKGGSRGRTTILHSSTRLSWLFADVLLFSALQQYMLLLLAPVPGRCTL